MVPEHIGLRDRKREETRSRLESAAVTLVLRDGLEHATVDSISAMADVSSRTFFNYFILALISPSIEGAALHEQRHEVLRRHPQLFGRHMAQMTRMIDQLVSAVISILENDRPDAPADRAQAEVLLTLCAGAVRTTVKNWVDENSAEPVDSLQPRATALVRTLIERIK